MFRKLALNNTDDQGTYTAFARNKPDPTTRTRARARAATPAYFRPRGCLCCLWAVFLCMGPPRPCDTGLHRCAGRARPAPPGAQGSSTRAGNNPRSSNLGVAVFSHHRVTTPRYTNAVSACMPARQVVALHRPEDVRPQREGPPGFFYVTRVVMFPLVVTRNVCCISNSV
jgi:hypothetical protein